MLAFVLVILSLVPLHRSNHHQSPWCSACSTNPIHGAGCIYSKATILTLLGKPSQLHHNWDRCKEAYHIFPQEQRMHTLSTVAWQLLQV